MIELDWVPPRSGGDLPPGVARATLRAFDRAVAAYRRQHRRYPRRAVVHWDGVKKIEKVEVH